jgi:hypothetical protein
MRDIDLKRLKQPYRGAVPGPPENRLGAALGIDLRPVVSLGDEILADLSRQTYGVGWWSTHSDLTPQVRICVSDYLIACARSLIENRIEAEVSSLEVAHAMEDFKKYVERGLGRRGLRLAAPRGPYDDLAHFRASAHFTGLLRALASSLDCLGGCIVGVAALPVDIVRTGLRAVLMALNKAHGVDGDPNIERLAEAVRTAEREAGPESWLTWLLEMRNTEVHRGRRIAAWEPRVREFAGVSPMLIELRRQLPVSPELTEVEAWIESGSYEDSLFDAPLAQVARSLSRSVEAYVNAVCAELELLWLRRRSEPALLIQPPEQWNRRVRKASASVFRGYLAADNSQPGESLSELLAADETAVRLAAAGLVERQGGRGVAPDARIWESAGS